MSHNVIKSPPGPAPLLPCQSPSQRAKFHVRSRGRELSRLQEEEEEKGCGWAQPEGKRPRVYRYGSGKAPGSRGVGVIGC